MSEHFLLTKNSSATSDIPEWKPNDKQLRENENHFSKLTFVALAFVHSTCIFNPRLQHSRHDLVFEQSRLRNNCHFRMFYSPCGMKKHKNSVKILNSCIQEDYHL